MSDSESTMSASNDNLVTTGGATTKALEEQMEIIIVAEKVLSKWLKA